MVGRSMMYKVIQPKKSVKEKLPFQVIELPMRYFIGEIEVTENIFINQRNETKSNSNL